MTRMPDHGCLVDPLNRTAGTFDRIAPGIIQQCGLPEYIDKTELETTGRASAMCGYGILQALELAEG